MEPIPQLLFSICEALGRLIDYVFWCRKNTDTNMMLIFHTLAALPYKHSIVMGLVHRRLFPIKSSKEVFDKDLTEANGLDGSERSSGNQSVSYILSATH